MERTQDRVSPSRLQLMKNESRRYNVANETGKEFYERIYKSRDNESFFELMERKYWPEYKRINKKRETNK